MPVVVTKLMSIDAGASVIGKVGVDQTTPGTTNGVYVNTLAAGGSVDIGALAAAAVTDPTASASVIATLKGLLKQLQGNGSGSTPVQESGCAAISTQNVTVAVAGTPVQGAAQACKTLYVTPYLANTGTIYVGASTVDSQTTPPVGTPIVAGSGPVPFIVTNANLLYFDATVGTDGVHILAFT